MYVTASDYEKGSLKINLNPQQVLDFNSIGLELENNVLKDLLGLELYGLYFDDLDSNNEPQADRFTAIFGEFENDCCRSKGIVDMVKKFAYFNYISFYAVKNTQNGQSMTNSETQTKISSLSLRDISIYNDAVKTYRSIREYIQDNIEDYPEFTGKQKDYKTII